MSGYDDIANNPLTQPAKPTRIDRGFAQEIFLSAQTQIGLTFDEEMSFSPLLNEEDRAARNSKIHKSILKGGADAPPNHVVSVYGNDYDKIAQYMYDEMGRDDIKTDAMLTAEKKDLLKMRREYAQETFSSMSPSARTIGQLGGGIIATAVDPIYLPGYFMGISQGARGLQLLAGVAKVAGTEAGLETLKQAMVTLPYKQQLGIDYNWQDAGLEVAFAAGLGATLDVGMYAVGKGLNKMLRKDYGSAELNLLRDDLAAEWGVAPYRVNELLEERVRNVNRIEEQLKKIETKGGKGVDTTLDSVENTTAFNKQLDEELKGVDLPEDLKQQQGQLDEMNEVLAKQEAGECKVGTTTPSWAGRQSGPGGVAGGTDISTPTTRSAPAAMPKTPKTPGSKASRRAARKKAKKQAKGPKDIQVAPVEPQSQILPNQSKVDTTDFNVARDAFNKVVPGE